MSKDIKDYIHLYLGCEAELLLSDEPEPYRVNIDGSIIDIDANNAHVMPILRPISSMTEEEKKEYNHRKQRKGYMPEVHAGNTLWLIQNHFDVFGLIHAGLALDATKLKEKI